MRRWARRASRALLAVCTAFVVLLGGFVAYGLTRNYLRAETRGTTPVERLARRGTPLEREATRALADSLAVNRFSRGWNWYASRNTSANGDTIRFRVYRAQDAHLLRRFVLPEPYMGGGAGYVVSERRLVGLGIGVR